MTPAQGMTRFATPNHRGLAQAHEKECATTQVVLGGRDLIAGQSFGTRTNREVFSFIFVYCILFSRVFTNQIGVNSHMVAELL